MTNKEKCCCKVFNKLPSKKGRVCRGNVWNKFAGKNYCYSHAVQIIGQSALNIQKVQRGKRSREIIDNIYKKLPTDIQRIIDSYINEEIYIQRENKVINKIIYNRFVKIEDLITKIKKETTLDWVYLNIYNTNNSLTYYYLLKEIIYILPLLNRDSNIYLIYHSEINVSFLVKLFTLTNHGIWGTTIWNGMSLESFTDYVTYIIDNIQQIHNDELNFACEYFELLADYWNIFKNSFNLERFSITNYRLSIRDF